MHNTTQPQIEEQYQNDDFFVHDFLIFLLENIESRIHSLEHSLPYSLFGGGDHYQQVGRIGRGLEAFGENIRICHDGARCWCSAINTTYDFTEFHPTLLISRLCCCDAHYQSNEAVFAGARGWCVVHQRVAESNRLLRVGVVITLQYMG